MYENDKAAQVAAPPLIAVEPLSVPSPATTMSTSPNLPRRIGLTLALGLLVGSVLTSTNIFVWLTMGFTSAVVAGAVMLGTRRERLPGIPDLIRGGTVFEHRGVQFALILPKGAVVSPGAPFEVVLSVQNCVVAPRTLVVQLRGKTDFISSPLRREFSLSPGVVAELRIPWTVRSLSRGPLDFELAVFSVGNTTGKRLRDRRGEAYDSSSEVLTSNLVGVVSLLATGHGHFALGSPSQFSIRVDEVQSADPRELHPSVKVLFSPSAEHLALAARTFSLPN